MNVESIDFQVAMFVSCFVIRAFLITCTFLIVRFCLSLLASLFIRG